MNTVTFTPAERSFASGTANADAYSGPEFESAPLVAQYLNIALRWKWLILACVAIALIGGILLTLLATPQYTANTRLEITREASRIVNVQNVEPETSAVNMEFYQTQYGLLESRSVAERVARELRLVDNKNFFAMFGRDDLFDAEGTVALAANRKERDRVAVEILLKQLEVSPLRLSRLVDLRWTSPDAAFSAQVANAWAAAFIQANLERRFEATAYARKFLEDRLEQLRGKLENSERQLVSYASDEAIINIPIGTGPDGQTQERSLTADSLATLNEALSKATADRIQAESRLRSSGGAAQEALTNPAIAQMRQRRAEAAAEYSRLMTQFEPGYPPAQALAAQVRDLDASIAREEVRVRRSLQEGFNEAMGREQGLDQKVDSLKDSFLNQRRRSIQYNIYQREVDTNRQLYDGLLQRYKEIGVSGGVGNNNVSIVDPADPPERPSSPRPVLNILLSLIVGLAAGVGLALIRSQMDETLSDPADVERRLGVPLLGAIPMTKNEEPMEELLDPKSGLSEAYLSVQSSLTFASDHGIPKSIAVTSTRAFEGKSTTSYALANAIARSGARTILIDADMRSPSVNEMVGISNRKGLSSYLTGQNDIDSLLQSVEGRPMSFMAAGPSPTNAAELLRGPRFAHLLEELSKRFDHVIIDAPPVMGLADAPTIASSAEGLLFVIQAGAVKARVARRALDRLRQARANVIGTVLTKFDPRRAMFDYGYGYGYGSRYGEEASAGSK